MIKEQSVQNSPFKIIEKESPKKQIKKINLIMHKIAAHELQKEAYKQEKLHRANIKEYETEFSDL